MLEFNRDTHTYTHGGVLVPGVTTVLKVLGGYENVPSHVLARAAALGTAVHLATELFDEGDLDERSLDPQIIPYLDAWRQFRYDREFTPAKMEQQVFHKKHWYAGTFDRTGIIEYEPGVIDIKTTVNMMPSTGPQLAAYKEAYNYGKSKTDKIKRRWVVQLKRDGTYTLQEKKEPSDLATFLSCLTIYNWRAKNG